ncbi:MAG: DUF4337 domain-containing protein [Gammaproteobacteria bacterium]|nr:DUF4337 domain-containing protein [Gammaproteobacteria bacterium]
MSEGHELHVDPHDSYGKRVGAQAAILAVLLSVFTICAHRAHTETIVLQNDSNDQWSQYQAKRIRDYQLEMNLDILKVVGATSPESTSLTKAYATKHEEYRKELEELKNDAKIVGAKSMLSEKKAMYFDFAEGVLEISLVMSSLYFLSHKKMFPRFGLLFGLVGALAGFLGLLL